MGKYRKEVKVTHNPCFSQFKLLYQNTKDCCSIAKQCLTLLLSVAHQASLSTGFSRQENWRGLQFPSPGGLPDPEIKPTSPALAG